MSSLPVADAVGASPAATAVPAPTRKLRRASPSEAPGSAKSSASFNFLAQSLQHTSTVLPRILTWIGLSPSSPSQAAQVFFVMTLHLQNTPMFAEHPWGGRRRSQILQRVGDPARRDERVIDHVAIGTSQTWRLAQQTNAHAVPG